MTNEIICTTDFSSSSKEALKLAISFAKKLGNRLIILYTYRLFKQNGEGIALKRKMETEATINFAELEKELLKESGVEYDFQTEVGFVDDRIEERLKKNKISLLVMGKGMSLQNKETFDNLISQLQIPLVIVP